MSPVDKLLERLDRVKRTGPGRWMASCPTREDRRPSLAIRELDDGRLLLHDFGGDDVASIVAAVGLDLTDLFPAQPGQFAGKVRRPFNAADVLALVAFESSVALIVCSDVMQYVATPELRRGLAAIRALLVGVAYLDVFSTADDVRGDTDGWHDRSPRLYRRLFAEAGLRPVGLHLYLTDPLAGDRAALEMAD